MLIRVAITNIPKKQTPTHHIEQKTAAVRGVYKTGMIGEPLTPSLHNRKAADCTNGYWRELVFAQEIGKNSTKW